MSRNRHHSPAFSVAARIAIALTTGALVASSATAAFAARGSDVAPARVRADSTERGVWVMLLGNDTISIERFSRRAGRAAGELIARGSPLLIRETLEADPQALVTGYRIEGIPLTTPDSAPTQRAVLEFRNDSLIATVGPGARPMTQRDTLARGAMPMLNLSSLLLEQLTRRARALGGNGTTLRVMEVAGGSRFPASVARVGTDSMTVTMGGVEMRLAVDAKGAMLGGVVPSQGLRIVRLPDARAEPVALVPVLGAASTANRYAAPSGAPYSADEVRVPTPAGHVLAGTLTRPRGGPSAGVPAVILVTGSGPQDRDEGTPALPKFRAFAQIADTLSRRGIAVLRLDDRGIGASGGTFAGATTADFADDTRAAVAFLRKQPGIDPSRIALLGHSEGAIVVPMVAADDRAVHAVVLMAAPAMTGSATSDAQVRYAIDHHPTYGSLSATAKDSLFRANRKVVDAMLEKDPWMRYWFALDPLPIARHVTAPVLLLQGETDTQVTPAQADQLATAMRGAGNRDVTVRRFPATNHLFVADSSGNSSRYTSLESLDVRPSVLGALADWLVLKLK